MIYNVYCLLDNLNRPSQQGKPVHLVSWNVNGLRAAGRKGLADWLARCAPDILCMQETRALPQQLSPQLRHPPGYHSYWFWAEKKGYSGVGLYSKTRPTDVRLGLGLPRFDHEGRVLTAHYPNFTLVNAYFPNGQWDHARVPFKMDFCAALLHYCQQLRQSCSALVLCGDFNTAHQPIDLARPQANGQNTGFLPQERAWIDDLMAAGYVDIFRSFHPEPGHYTWWTYRNQARQRNLGWRIDYHFVTPELVPYVAAADHMPDVLGSDHCPIGLQLDGHSSSRST
ncbi:MAG: exodeoxyribonuclease III [Candidatus Latescibacteria bacterium]|nr:exodeoxyribonuclease III [Candidatus Latescibacterota bacterium]